MHEEITDIQSWGRGNLVVPFSKFTLTVFLGLRYMKDFVLQRVSFEPDRTRQVRLTRYGSGTAADTRRSQTYEAQVRKIGNLTAHLGRLLPPLLEGMPLKSNVQTPVPRANTRGPRGVVPSPAIVKNQTVVYRLNGRTKILRLELCVREKKSFFYSCRRSSLLTVYVDDRR
jgi:hypothetical protein